MTEKEDTNNGQDPFRGCLCSCAFPTISLLCARQRDESTAELSPGSPRTPEHGLEGEPWCPWVGLNEEQPTSIFCRGANTLFTATENLSCAMRCSRHSLAQCCTGMSYGRTSELQRYNTQTSRCGRRRTQDFEDVIKDPKFPTTLRQEDMKKETSVCTCKQYKICKYNVRNSKYQQS